MKTMDIELERKMLQTRVDLANEVYCLEGERKIILEGTFKLRIPATAQFGGMFATYGFCPSLIIGLEAFLEGLIMGGARNKPEFQAKLEKLLEDEGN